MNELLGH